MMAPRPPLPARAAHRRRLAIIRQWLFGRWLLLLPCLCLLLGAGLAHPPALAQDDTRTTGDDSVRVERLLPRQGPPQPVTLPWGFAQGHLDRSVTEHFRVRVPPGTQALMVGRTLGDLSLVWQGTRLPALERDGPPRTLHAHVFALPQAASGQWLALEVQAPAGYRGELGPITAGDLAQLDQASHRQRERQTMFQLVLAGIGMTVAMAASLYWVIRPRHTVSLYLALAAAMLGGRNVLMAALGVPDMPSPGGQWLVAWNTVAIFCVVGYCLRSMEPRRSRAEPLLMALTACQIALIALGWHVHEWHRWLLWLQSCAAIGWVVWLAWLRGVLWHDGLMTALLGIVSLQLISLGVNLARFGTPLTADTLQMPLVTGPVFLLLWGMVLARRFDRLLAGYRELNESLQGQVEAKSGELLRLFASMQAKEREKVMADERARLMQEMHDGLGARVTAALHILRREQSSPVAAAALDDALTDMRMIMDALEPNDGDLATILGNLRYRLEPRLNAAGFELGWDVEPLDTQVQLTASQVLHLQRIVEEALTNAIKHSGGHRIRVSLHRQPGSPGVDIGIQDDGHTPTGPASPRGHGLGNMASRAASIGARLSVERNDQGTLVRLTLPLPKPESATGMPS